MVGTYGFTYNIVVNKNMRLCSTHFEKNCLKLNKVYTNVHNDSIPTIFGEYKNMCIYCKEKKGASKILFHRFPFNDNALLQKWLETMNCKDLHVTSKSLLCSKHFENTCYRPNSGRSGIRLKTNAVPTLFQEKYCSISVTLQQTEILQESPSYQSSEAESFTESINKSSIKKNKNTRSANESPDITKRLRLSFYSHISDISLSNNVVAYEASEIDNSTNENEALSVSTSASLTPKTVKKAVFNDHNYTSTPRSMKKNLDRARKSLSIKRSLLKGKNKEIRILKKKVANLQEIIQQWIFDNI